MSLAHAEQFGSPSRGLLLLGAAASIALLMALVLHLSLPPLSAHMLTHVLTMGVIAPVTAVLLLRNGWSIVGSVVPSLLLAGGTQLLLLSFWHLPFALELAHSTALVAVTMHLSLLFVAIWFWAVVAASDPQHRPAAIVALLATGKLFCLLGAFLAFAPWPFYSHIHADAHMHMGVQALADQHAAGLIMLLMCPLTYVGASIILTLKALGDDTACELDRY
ncbi:MAG: hypothetical protein EKK41_02085 [Hyphomicrobiales bacterium]|nr:MAG: hypothetical protein EKK41_02085 [Hyphomicrobiales bacterium]